MKQGKWIVCFILLFVIGVFCSSSRAQVMFDPGCGGIVSPFQDYLPAQQPLAESAESFEENTQSLSASTQEEQRGGAELKATVTRVKEVLKLWCHEQSYRVDKIAEMAYNFDSAYSAYGQGQAMRWMVRHQNSDTLHDLHRRVPLRDTGDEMVQFASMMANNSELPVDDQGWAVHYLSKYDAQDALKSLAVNPDASRDARAMAIIYLADKDADVLIDIAADRAAPVDSRYSALTLLRDNDSEAALSNVALNPKAPKDSQGLAIGFLSELDAEDALISIAVNSNAPEKSWLSAIIFLCDHGTDRVAQVAATREVPEDRRNFALNYLFRLSQDAKEALISVADNATAPQSSRDRARDYLDQLSLVDSEKH